MTQQKTDADSGFGAGDWGPWDGWPRFADQVSATNATVLGLGPAVAVVNTYLGQSMAQQQLFIDAVQQQSNDACVARTATIKGVKKILDLDEQYVEE